MNINLHYEKEYLNNREVTSIRYKINFQNNFIIQTQSIVNSSF